MSDSPALFSLTDQLSDLKHLFYLQVNEVKAVPLASGDRYNYLLALKQEYRANMKESIYYIKVDEKRKDIERYSDKFQLGQQANKQGCIGEKKQLYLVVLLRKLFPCIIMYVRNVKIFF